MSQELQRFIGLDIHKAYVVAAAVDAQQSVLLQLWRIAIDDLPAWLEGHLVRAMRWCWKHAAWPVSVPEYVP